MSMDASDLWKWMDNHRDRRRGDVSLLVDWIKDNGERPTVATLEYYFKQTQQGMHAFPVDLLAFIRLAIADGERGSALFPWIDSGVLNGYEEVGFNFGHVDALGMNKELAELNALLHGEQVNVVCANPIPWLETVKRKYDVIVCATPWGLHMREFRKVELGGITIQDNFGELVLASALQHLKPDGICVFIAAPSFFSSARSRRNSLRNQLNNLGFSVTAVIEIPSGSFAPLTQISPSVVLIEAGKRKEQIFVGEYGRDTKHQQYLLDNFGKKVNARRIQQGLWVNEREFDGYRRLEAQIRAETQAAAMGFDKVAIREVALEIRPFDQSREGQEASGEANTIYLPTAITGKAVSDPQELADRSKGFQIGLNPAAADARFVAQLLQTPLGDAILTSTASGNTIPMLTMTTLRDAVLYLPPVGQQGQVVTVQRRLDELKREVEEVEQLLWQKPQAVSETEKALVKINHEDRFQDWIDTLPFPLASILWRYHVQTGGMKSRMERLLHFFEALAEFLSTIHLSAYRSHDDLWWRDGKAVKDELDRNHLSLEMSTFGTWTTIAGALSKRTRTYFNKPDSRELIHDAYRIRDHRLISMLTEKRLITAINMAVKIRNDIAHGGVANEEYYAVRHDTLRDQLQAVRSVFGNSWNELQLYLCEGMRRFKGVYTNKCRRVMGTRIPFEVCDVSLIEGLEDSALHLVESGASRALSLLPFVRMLPSPKTDANTCYFYSRAENGGRFISYYQESDPEISGIDTDFEEALRNFFPSDETVGQ